jgi:hypothetical protein
MAAHRPENNQLLIKFGHDVSTSAALVFLLITRRTGGS